MCGVGVKKIIIGVVALAVLAGGGFAGWEFFLRDFLASEEKVEKVELPPKPFFVTIGSFDVPVIEGHQVTRMVKVRIAVEIAEGQSMFALRGYGPPLRDAYLAELVNMVMWHKIEGGHALHLPSVKKRLMTATEEIVGKGVVAQVLVDMILEHG